MRPRRSRRRRWAATLPHKPTPGAGLVRGIATGLLVVLLGGCAVVPSAPQADRTAPVGAPTTVRPTLPQPASSPERTGFGYAGSRMQGGLLLGTAPDHTRQLLFDGVAIPVAADGRFVIAFDRDAGPSATLAATRDDGVVIRDTLSIAPRAWDISRLSTLPKIPLPQPEFDAVRPAELAQIVAARRIQTDAQGWRQAFLWPTTGRISTLFGSQRIYRNGEAGSYHSGLDVAKPTGSVIVAPADGVVILAADHPFTLEGNLLMIDHGMGLNSAFLHLSAIQVHVGDHVRRGQPIALSGATGRATGPHLHWSLRWRDAKIDPLLVAGPMPAQ
jgi:murein DD-endopeptidase MepM/ murein hydrolase activator NlpD